MFSSALRNSVALRIATRARALSITPPTNTTACIPSTTKQEAKMYLQFQCTNADCEQATQEDRMVKKFISKLAYEEGVVLVRCKCEKLHLIADRLEWFEDGGTDIEKIAQQKGVSFSTTTAQKTELAKLAKEKGIFVDIE